MGVLAQNLPRPEGWEVEEERFLKSTLSGLSYRHRMAILLSVGLVTAVEISNRLSVNVLLPDMQGNVGASSDTISWVVILYNVGFLLVSQRAGHGSRRVGIRQGEL